LIDIIDDGIGIRGTILKGDIGPEGSRQVVWGGIGPRKVARGRNQIILLIDPDERIIDYEHDLAINQSA